MLICFVIKTDSQFYPHPIAFYHTEESRFSPVQLILDSPLHNDTASLERMKNVPPLFPRAVYGFVVKTY